jgi:hypothetical protein
VVERVRGGHTAKRFMDGVVEVESVTESYGGWLESFVEGRFRGPWKGDFGEGHGEGRGRE